MASSDDEIVKQPIRRLEIPINKFNDVAIPHHLDLLKKHKNNISKVSSFLRCFYLEFHLKHFKTNYFF